MFDIERAIMKVILFAMVVLIVFAMIILGWLIGGGIFQWWPIQGLNC